MITLNQDKELVRISSWEEIEQRVGFAAPLDPNEHTLKGIIGQYALADEIPCGLSSCRTLHLRGYLVVTQSGLETNLGKDCGKRHFGVDFESMRNSFDRDMREKEQRERLGSLKFRIDEYRARLSDLRDGPNGADALWRDLRPFREPAKGAPKRLVQELRSMLKTGRSVLTIGREASEAEIAQAEAAEGRRFQRPHYITVPVGEVRGMTALGDDMDLRQLVVLDLLGSIDRFEQVQIDALGPAELGRWARWESGLEAQFEKVNASLDAARAFLDGDNLLMMGKAIDTKEDRAEYQKLLHLLSARSWPAAVPQASGE